MLRSYIKNQISTLSDPFPSLDNVFQKLVLVGSSCLKYLLITPLMLQFVFCLFYRIVFPFTIANYGTDPPTKIMTRWLAIVDQIYSSVCYQ